VMGDLDDVTVANYTFGAPKNGNWIFKKLYDKLVPNTFRTVVDGDIVVSLPPTWSYVPCGTEVLVDPKGAGSIIIDPSFVERRLRTSVRSSISVHAMTVYKLGIDGVHDAAVFLQRQAMNEHEGQFDSVQVALTSRPLRSSSTGISFDAVPDDSWHGNVSLRPFEVFKQEPSHRSYRKKERQHKSKESTEDTKVEGSACAEQWGYEMDVSSSSTRSEESDLEKNISSAAASTRRMFSPLSSTRCEYAPAESIDCDRLDEFSRMALSVEMENEGATFSPLLDLSLTHAKQAVSFVTSVPLSLFQNVLVRAGFQEPLDDQEIEDIMSATVPRRSEVAPSVTSESLSSRPSSQWGVPALSPTKGLVGMSVSSPPPSE
jgi:hypothetical protein